MNFHSIGVNYRSAGAEARDRVVFSDEAIDRIREISGAVQSVALATCNRAEIFYCGEDKAMRDAFTGVFPVPVESLAEHSGEDAIVYLCRIASGMESMIFGEYQILGQVKDAYRASLDGGFVGRELDRIFRDAISAAKCVRTELDIGAVPPSVCRAGMDIVERTAGIGGKRVFVIGSGKTGSLAVEIARERGAGEIHVCNRSPERVQRLIDLYGVKSVGYAERYEVMTGADIVISATASPHVVIRAEEARIDHPVTILDLASPRDIDPKLAENALVKLLSIDTIGVLAVGDRDEHARLESRGMRIIGEAVRKTMEWLG